MKKILIVEDDSDIHNLIKDILEKEEYECLFWNRGNIINRKE